MGTIAQEITRINTAKANIKTSIESKGVQVPSDALISTYSGYIDQIQTGGGGVTIPAFNNAQNLFFWGRLVEIEPELFNAYDGNNINQLCNYISDSSKKLSNATLNKWIKKTIDYVDSAQLLDYAYFTGMLNNCTVYGGDTLTFDYSNYDLTKDISITLSGFASFGSTSAPAKMVINFDNSTKTYKFLISNNSIVGTGSQCPDIELYGILSPSITTYTINNTTLSNNNTYFSKVVLKNMNANTTITVRATSTVTDLTTWQNSLQHYTNNVGPIIFKVGATNHTAIVNAGLDTQYAQYNITFIS